MSRSVTISANPTSLRLNGRDRLGGRLARALTAAVRLWIIRRDERMLVEMPDDRLKDIGISRGDIGRVVRVGRD